MDAERGGVIDTEDGAAILLSMHGQSVEQQVDEGFRRAIIVRLELTSDAEQYRWLNTTFVVAEGEIDEDTEAISFQAYVCVNDAVEHAPAIGQAPPDRFRQGS